MNDSFRGVLCMFTAATKWLPHLNEHASLVPRPLLEETLLTLPDDTLQIFLLPSEQMTLSFQGSCACSQLQ